MEPRRTVVLVDDSLNDADFVASAVALAGPDVTLVHFSRGEDALARIREMHPEDPSFPTLMIVDLKMPVVSGVEVVRGVRTRFGRGVLPIVVYTSSKEPNDVRQAYLAGANSYVVKPVAFEAFIEAVAGILGYWLRVNCRAVLVEGEHG